jgi:hypothetical protein
MHTHLLVLAASNPITNWTNEWKAGWDNAPAVGSPHAATLGYAVVALLILVLVMGFRKLGSSG